MERLIELLNEYENTLEPNEQIEWTENGVRATPLVIISKKFGFIKRLVENEKIDRDKIIINSDFIPVASDRKGKKYEWSEEKQLLMLLSISDTPIEDLISYLR